MLSDNSEGTVRAFIAIELDAGVREALVQTAAQAMAEAARLPMPFAVELGTVGGFPSLQHPLVLWVGISGGGDALATLGRDMALRLRGEGFVLEDRPFAPHLTLGRVLDGGRSAAVALARTPPALPHAGQIARRVTLFRSELRWGRVVYIIHSGRGRAGRGGEPCHGRRTPVYC